MMEVKDKLRKVLSSVTGVLHVGANNGREAALYQSFNLSVLWIEPIPEIYKELKKQISKLENQIALNELIVDEDGKEYMFNIANNNGASSSLFDFSGHKDIWPDVKFIGSMPLNGISLGTLYDRKKIEPNKYQVLVIDVQGSELLVLQGAREWLSEFEFIHLEVANFDSYKNGCTTTDIEAFMRENKYIEIERECFAKSTNGRKYFNILYKKVSSNFL